MIIEFSRLQVKTIVDCLIASGHIIDASTTGCSGIAVADDNLAVSSPEVTAKFLLPFDDKLGKALS